MERDPNNPSALKNSFDLSIFDKPRVQLSRSINNSERIRDSVKESDFLKLNMTKPAKKEIILADNPDFTLDKDYYENQFQKPPEQDEDLIRYSMQSNSRMIDPDPIINTSSHLNKSKAYSRNEGEGYQKNEEYDDTFRQSQLRGKMGSREDVINIGDSQEDISRKSYKDNTNYDDEQFTDNVGQRINTQEDLETEKDRTIESQNRSSKQGAQHEDDEDHAHPSEGQRTPISNKSKGSRKSKQSNK